MAHPPKNNKQIHWTTQKISCLKRLYQSGFSMRQVDDRMGCSTASINHAMRRYSLPRRTTAQTKHIQFTRSPLSFSPNNKLTTKQKHLKTAGIMLYWAEGSKRNAQGVDFANSDPSMIFLFTEFLRQIYQVNEKRLRCLLYCYPSHKVNKLIDFWSNITKIPLLNSSNLISGMMEERFMIK